MEAEFKIEIDSNDAIESIEIAEMPEELGEKIYEALMFLEKHPDQPSINIILTIKRS